MTTAETNRARVLFVDDEPSIRLTLPAVLQMHGFEVTPTGTVAEALAAMQSRPFDVLIADLNIGQPGDGFTVVSAMRRTQPDAVTIILTGYPAFETALQAIRSQVDDYVVKPANVGHLVELIEARLRHHTPSHQVPFRSVGTILRESKSEIMEEWMVRCKADPQLGAVKLSDRERKDHVPALLEELIRMLDSGQQVPSDAALRSASEHGHERRRQNFSIPMIVLETRFLRDVIYRSIQQNLLSVDISHVFTDMMEICDALDELMRKSIEEYLRAAVKVAS